MKSFKHRVQKLTGSRVTSLSNATANLAIYTTETADQETIYLVRYGDAEQINYGKIVPEEDIYFDIDNLYDVIHQTIKEGYEIYIAEEIQEYFDTIDSDSDFWQELLEELTETV